MHQPVHPTRPNLRLFVCSPPRTLLQSALGYPTRYLLWSDRDLSTEPHYAPVCASPAGVPAVLRPVTR